MQGSSKLLLHPSACIIASCRTPGKGFCAVSGQTMRHKALRHVAKCRGRLMRTRATMMQSASAPLTTPALPQATIRCGTAAICCATSANLPCRMLAGINDLPSSSYLALSCLLGRIDRHGG